MEGAESEFHMTNFFGLLVLMNYFVHEGSDAIAKCHLEKSMLLFGQKTIIIFTARGGKIRKAAIGTMLGKV